ESWGREGLGLSAEGAANGGEPGGCDRPPHPAAALLAREASRGGEDSRVVADGGLALAERVLERTRAHLAFGRDQREEAQADRVGECGEHLGELDGFAFAERRRDERGAAQLGGSGLG